MDGLIEPAIKEYKNLKGEEKVKAQKLFLELYFGQELSLENASRAMKKEYRIEVSSNCIGEEIARLGHTLRGKHDHLKKQPTILERYGEQVKKHILEMRNERKPPISYHKIAEKISIEIQPISETIVRKIEMAMENEMEGGFPPYRSISIQLPS